MGYYYSFIFFTSNNIKNASKSAAELSNTYVNASENLKKDLTVNEQYVNSVKSATASVNDLKDKYNKSAETYLRTG